MSKLCMGLTHKNGEHNLVGCFDSNDCCNNEIEIQSNLEHVTADIPQSNINQFPPRSAGIVKMRQNNDRNNRNPSFVMIIIQHLVWGGCQRKARFTFGVIKF